MADNFDVFLRLILDPQEKEKAKQGVKEVEKEVQRLDKDLEKTGNTAKKTGRDLQKSFKDAELQATKTALALDIVGAGIESISRKGLLLSAGFLTGIFAFAGNYVKNADTATRTTNEWNRQTERLADAGERVGAVLARTILPLLEDAADVAERIADVIEKNPALASAAVNTAVLVGALSTVGSLIGRLSQIAGALKLAGVAGEGSGLAASAGPAALLIAAPVIGAIIAKEVGNAIQKALGQEESTWKDILTTYLQYLSLPGKALILILRETGLISAESAKKINEFQNNIFGFGKAVDDTSKTVSDAIDGLRGNKNEQEIVDAFIQMKDAELKAEQDFQRNRQSIIDSANKSILASTASNARAISGINARAESNRAKIISDFRSASAEAERKYASERANIIRDGSIDIQRIEKKRLEDLRKLEQEHADNVDDLAANRDALGLVLEQRSFDRKRSELDRQTNEEIAQRRQDLAIRLQDLAANFQAERAQKQAQYVQALAENEARRQEELKIQQKKFAEETKEIEAQKAQRLRELQIQHNEERQRIREAFIARVRDLDASLIGEQRLKQQYYQAMLADADRFLSAYKAKLGSIGSGTTSISGGLGGGLRGYAEGGYTPNGPIRTHSGEFVTNARTTRALESAIGGRLNQQSLMLMAARGVSSGITLNDYRRFSGEYTKGMKREIVESTLMAVKEAFAR